MRFAESCRSLSLIQGEFATCCDGWEVGGSSSDRLESNAAQGAGQLAFCKKCLENEHGLGQFPNTGHLFRKIGKPQIARRQTLPVAGRTREISSITDALLDSESSISKTVTQNRSSVMANRVESINLKAHVIAVVRKSSCRLLNSPVSAGDSKP
jgi:hypothetical protein